MHGFSRDPRDVHRGLAAGLANNGNIINNDMTNSTAQFLNPLNQNGATINLTNQAKALTLLNRSVEYNTINPEYTSELSNGKLLNSRGSLIGQSASGLGGPANNILPSNLNDDFKVEILGQQQVQQPYRA